MKFCIIFITVLYILRYTAAEYTKPKIAIIGAGIGGASCALFLNDLLNDVVEIHVYEQNNKIGGRLAPVELDGGAGAEAEAVELLDTGRGIFTEKDFYTNQLIRRFNFKKSTPPTVYIYNGVKLFSPNLWSQLPTPSKNKISKFLKPINDTFKKVYNDLDKFPLKSYDSITLSSPTLNFSLKSISTEEYFKNLKITNEWTNICKNRLLIDYNQSLEDINYNTGQFLLNKIGRSANVIRQGAHELVNKCLKESKAKLHLQHKIIKLQREIFTIVTSIDENNCEKSENFNYVIIASPLAKNLPGQIKFENYDPTFFQKPEGEFKTTWTTFVEGILKKSPLGAAKPDHIVFSNNFYNNAQEKINSIMKLKSMSTKRNVWRIESKNKLTGGDVEKFFQPKAKIIKHSAQSVAYPDYKTGSNILVGLYPFVLVRNLLYINSIERIGSTMEMSIIGAKNAANRIHAEVQKFAESQWKRQGICPKCECLLSSPTHIQSCSLNKLLKL